MFPYLTLYFRYSFGKLHFVGLWQLWIHTDTLALLPTFLIFVLEMKTKTWHQTLVSCLSADITPTKTKQTCRWAESEGFPTGSTTKLIWTVFILLWDELSNWRQQFHRDGNDIRITFSSLHFQLTLTAGLRHNPSVLYYIFCIWHVAYRQSQRSYGSSALKCRSCSTSSCVIANRNHSKQLVSVWLSWS